MSSSSLKNGSGKTEKPEKSLPWWVELLFVQIGLPDKMLPKLLAAKKNSNKLYHQNKRLIIFLILIFSGLVYTKPITTYLYKQNQCINSTTNNLLKGLENSEFNKIDINSIAVNYCNGGNK